MTKAKLLAAAALLLLAGCFSAFAQNAPGQDMGQDKGQEPPPVADKGVTAQAKCIDEHDGYTMRGKQPMFVIQLTNKCEQRIVCKVFAYVTSARGTAQGRSVLTLAAKSGGAAATRSYSFKAKSANGNSISDRECRAL